MRISTAQIFDTGARHMGRAQTEIARTQEQIAAGKRLLSPADDPAAAAIALAIRQDKARSAQYQRNADLAEGDLRQQDSVLESVGNVLLEVKDLAMQAGNATLSVSEVHDAEAPATFTDGSGWTFTDGSGTYDRKTGALSVDFPGAIEFGNTSRGNYAFKLASPSIELDDEGAGTLTAEFSVRPAGATAYDAASRLVVLDIVGAESTRTKKTVEVTAAPTEFSSELVAAAADLAAHFQATGSANDANKPPAPITLTFDYKVKKK